MAEGINQLSDNVQAAVMQGMATEAAGAAGTRVRRWDQLAADSGSMWAQYLTSPSPYAAKAGQTYLESGAGRTRAETNRPAETSAAGPLP